MGKLFGALIIGLLASTGVSAVVIDFGPLFHTGEHQAIDDPPVYEEDGFAITAETGLASWGTASSHYPGSAALFNDYFPDEATTLARSDAAAFFLTSIDLAELFDDSAIVTVEFVGTKSDSSTVSQSFTLDGFHDGTLASFETFLFDASFTDLVSVRWDQTSEWHQFDNITASVVPEPGSALLLGLGLGALAARRTGGSRRPPGRVRARIAPVWMLAALLAGLPSPGSALSFAFQKSFDVAAFGSSAGGTPRGVAVFGSSLLVNDALDDQIFTVDPVGETATATWETDPFACAPLASCVPTQEWARIAWDVAFDGTDVWVVDKESVNGSTTWLIQLDGNGGFLERFDADVAGANPGGLTFDPRGSGGLLVTDRGLDWVVHFDLAGTALGISSLKPGGVGSEASTGIAHYAGDRFLVSDPGDDTVYEFQIPSGGGAASLLGESSFPGFDFATQIPDAQSLDYDPLTQTLYVLDGLNDELFVFSLVPEPGTGALLALGLAALGCRRRSATR